MHSKLDLEKQSLTVRVPGDLTSTTAEAVRGELGELFEISDGSPRHWTVFRLDLTGAKMVDSVGLNLVVTLLKRVRELGGRMQVVYSSQNVWRTFSFTRLDKQVELVKE